MSFGRKKEGQRVVIGKTEQHPDSFEGGEGVEVDLIDNSRSVDNILPDEKDMGLKDLGRGLPSDLGNMPTVPKSGEIDGDPMRFPEGEVKERKRGRVVVHEPDRGITGVVLGSRKRHTEDMDNFPADIKEPEEEAIDNEQKEKIDSEEGDEAGIVDYYEGLASGLDFEEEYDKNDNTSEGAEEDNWSEMENRGISDEKEIDKSEDDEFGDEFTPREKVGVKKVGLMIDKKIDRSFARDKIFKEEDKRLFAIKRSRGPKDVEGKNTGRRIGGHPPQKPRKTDRETIRGKTAEM
ncbi:MAG: hypothetical protein HOA57_01640 [Candidatus Magasanikbacteria bacterium]|jgi:hypothetical protein|nr:hypothetical protein [Candidatus Magasanikbacteria bacterium]MBT6819058.1 hypothetical protein [Candidatus Magasanikbacteria bacterium]